MTQKQISVNFGSNKSGLSTIGYTLYNYDGTEKQARTTSGVAERGTSTGIYGALISFEDSWKGSIVWDTGEATPHYAVEDYNVGDSGGGGYAVVADQIWTIKEKEEMFLKINKIFESLKRIKIIQDKITESGKSIDMVRDNLIKINFAVKEFESKQKFEDLGKQITLIESLINNSSKSGLFTSNKMKKEIIDNIGSIKKTIEDNKPKDNEVKIFESISLLDRALGKAIKDIGLVVRIGAKSLSDEDLKTILREEGIDVDSFNKGS